MVSLNSHTPSPPPAHYAASSSEVRKGSAALAGTVSTDLSNPTRSGKANDALSASASASASLPSQGPYKTSHTYLSKQSQASQSQSQPYSQVHYETMHNRQARPSTRPLLSISAQLVESPVAASTSTKPSSFIATSRRDGSTTSGAPNSQYRTLTSPSTTPMRQKSLGVKPSPSTTETASPIQRSHSHSQLRLSARHFSDTDTTVPTKSVKWSYESDKDERANDRQSTTQPRTATSAPERQVDLGHSQYNLQNQQQSDQSSRHRSLDGVNSTVQCSPSRSRGLSQTVGECAVADTVTVTTTVPVDQGEIRNRTSQESTAERQHTRPRQSLIHSVRNENEADRPCDERTQQSQEQQKAANQTEKVAEERNRRIRNSSTERRGRRSDERGRERFTSYYPPEHRPEPDSQKPINEHRVQAVSESEKQDIQGSRQASVDEPSKRESQLKTVDEVDRFSTRQSFEHQKNLDNRRLNHEHPRIEPETGKHSLRTSRHSSPDERRKSESLANIADQHEHDKGISSKTHEREICDIRKNNERASRDKIGENLKHDINDRGNNNDVHTSRINDEGGADVSIFSHAKQGDARENKGNQQLVKPDKHTTADEPSAGDVKGAQYSEANSIKSEQRDSSPTHDDKKVSSQTRKHEQNPLFSRIQRHEVATSIKSREPLQQTETKSSKPFEDKNQSEKFESAGGEYSSKHQTSISTKRLLSPDSIPSAHVIASLSPSAQYTTKKHSATSSPTQKFTGPTPTGLAVKARAQLSPTIHSSMRVRTHFDQTAKEQNQAAKNKADNVDIPSKSEGTEIGDVDTVDKTMKKKSKSADDEKLKSDAISARKISKNDLSNSDGKNVKSTEAMRRGNNDKPRSQATSIRIGDDGGIYVISSKQSSSSSKFSNPKLGSERLERDSTTLREKTQQAHEGRESAKTSEPPSSGPVSVFKTQNNNFTQPKTRASEKTSSLAVKRSEAKPLKPSSSLRSPVKSSNNPSDEIHVDKSASTKKRDSYSKTTTGTQLKQSNGSSPASTTHDKPRSASNLEDSRLRSKGRERDRVGERSRERSRSEVRSKGRDEGGKEKEKASRSESVGEARFSRSSSPGEGCTKRERSESTPARPRKSLMNSKRDSGTKLSTTSKLSLEKSSEKRSTHDGNERRTSEKSEGKDSSKIHSASTASPSTSLVKTIQNHSKHNHSKHSGPSSSIPSTHSKSEKSWSRASSPTSKAADINMKSSSDRSKSKPMRPGWSKKSKTVRSEGALPTPDAKRLKLDHPTEDRHTSSSQPSSVITAEKEENKSGRDRIGSEDDPKSSGLAGGKKGSTSQADDSKITNSESKSVKASGKHKLGLKSSEPGPGKVKKDDGKMEIDSSPPHSSKKSNQSLSRKSSSSGMDIESASHKRPSSKSFKEKSSRKSDPSATPPIKRERSSKRMGHVKSEKADCQDEADKRALKDLGKASDLSSKTGVPKETGVEAAKCSARNNGGGSSTCPSSLDITPKSEKRRRHDQRQKSQRPKESRQPKEAEEKEAKQAETHTAKTQCHGQQEPPSVPIHDLRTLLSNSSRAARTGGSSSAQPSPKTQSAATTPKLSQPMPVLVPALSLMRSSPRSKSRNSSIEGKLNSLSSLLNVTKSPTPSPNMSPAHVLSEEREKRRTELLKQINEIESKILKGEKKISSLTSNAPKEMTSKVKSENVLSRDTKGKVRKKKNSKRQTSKSDSHSQSLDKHNLRVGHKMEQLIQALDEKAKKEREPKRSLHPVHSHLRLILSQNMSKAAAAHAELRSLCHDTEAGLSAAPVSQDAIPSLTPETLRRVAIRIRQQKQDFIERRRKLTREYLRMRNSWTARLKAAREKWTKEKREAVRDRDRHLLLSTRGQHALMTSKTSSGRTTTKIVPSVAWNGHSSGAPELDAILAEIEAEGGTPGAREIWSRTLATVPDQNPRHRPIDCSSVLVENPVAAWHESRAVNPWMLHEKLIFLDKFIMYPKNFRKISSFLEHKSTRECARFYFDNKLDLGMKQLLKESSTLKRKGTLRAQIVAIAKKRWSCDAGLVIAIKSSSLMQMSGAQEAVDTYLADKEIQLRDVSRDVKQLHLSLEERGDWGVYPMKVSEKFVNEWKGVDLSGIDHASFMQAYRKHGTDWRAIGVMVGDPAKTSGQFREYYRRNCRRIIGEVYTKLMPAKESNSKNGHGHGHGQSHGGKNKSCLLMSSSSAGGAISSGGTGAYLTGSGGVSERSASKNEQLSSKSPDVYVKNGSSSGSSHPVNVVREGSKKKKYLCGVASTSGDIGDRTDIDCGQVHASTKAVDKHREKDRERDRERDRHRERDWDGDRKHANASAQR